MSIAAEIPYPGPSAKITMDVRTWINTRAEAKRQGSAQSARLAKEVQPRHDHGTPPTPKPARNEGTTDDEKTAITATSLEGQMSSFNRNRGRQGWRSMNAGPAPYWPRLPAISSGGGGSASGLVHRKPRVVHGAKASSNSAVKQTIAITRSSMQCPSMSRFPPHSLRLVGVTSISSSYPPVKSPATATPRWRSTATIPTPNLRAEPSFSDDSKTGSNPHLASIAGDQHRRGGGMATEKQPTVKGGHVGKAAG